MFIVELSVCYRYCYQWLSLVISGYRCSLVSALSVVMTLVSVKALVKSVVIVELSVVIVELSVEIIVGYQKGYPWLSLPLAISGNSLEQALS